MEREIELAATWQNTLQATTPETLTCTQDTTYLQQGQHVDSGIASRRRCLLTFARASDRSLINAPADRDTEKDSIAATTGTHKVALCLSLELTLEGHGERGSFHAWYPSPRYWFPRQKF
jgi:hypothetical protein